MHSLRGEERTPLKMFSGTCALFIRICGTYVLFACIYCTYVGDACVSPSNSYIPGESS